MNEVTFRILTDFKGQPLYTIQFEDGSLTSDYNYAYMVGLYQGTRGRLRMYADRDVYLAWDAYEKKRLTLPRNDIEIYE